MPGVMIRAFIRRMLSLTARMDADVDNADRGDDNSPQHKVDQPNASLKVDVKGSVNSDVKKNYTSAFHIENHVNNMHVHKGERTKDVPSIKCGQDAEGTIDISVPAKEGETIMHVKCTKDKILYYYYGHCDGQKRPFQSTWFFKNVPEGLMETILKDSRSFFELIRKWQEQYRSKLKEAHNRECLVLEFLHDTKEDRDKMMEDQEEVKTMFMEFLSGIGKDAPECSLQVLIPDEEGKETIAAHPKDSQLTNTSDSDSSCDSDIFLDAIEVEEDVEQDVSMPSKSVTEDMKETFDINPEGMPLIKTSTSDPEMSILHSMSSLTTATPISRNQGYLEISLHGEMMISHCTYCDDDDREETEGHFISLKNLACSALRLHPLPASAISLYDCTTCSRVWGDPHHFKGTEDTVFTMHLHWKHIDIKTRRMKPHAEYQFKKALSAMRNSGGGTLFVHVCDDISKGENTFRTTVVPVLESLLTDDETMSDAFSWRSLESRQGQVYKIEVLPSDTFITVDVKTKLSGWCRDKHVSASFQKLRPLLLFPRNVSTAEPTVQGLTRINQVDAVKIYVDNTPWYYSLHAPFHTSSALVNAIIDDHSLPEYVTSVSKRKQGGSVYVGQRRYDNTDDMSGVPYPMEGGKYGLQSMLADRLQKEIFIFKNRHSNVVLKTKDVFQIEIHDTGPNSGIIEVAVRPVDGCVFTDALGPVSFRIENKSLGEHHYKAFVRLSIDEWMETASG